MESKEILETTVARLEEEKANFTRRIGNDLKVLKTGISLYLQKMKIIDSYIEDVVVREPMSRKEFFALTESFSPTIYSESLLLKHRYVDKSKKNTYRFKEFDPSKINKKSKRRRREYILPEFIRRDKKKKSHQVNGRTIELNNFLISFLEAEKARLNQQALYFQNIYDEYLTF